MNRLKIWPWMRPFLIIILAISIPPVVYWFGYVQSSVSAAKRQAFTTLAAVAEDFGSRLAAHDQIAKNAEAYSHKNPLLTNYLKSLLGLKTPPSILRVDNLPHIQVAGESGRVLLNVGALADSDYCKPGPACIVQVIVPVGNLIPRNAVEAEFDGLLILSVKNEVLTQDRRLPAQPVGVPLPLQFRGAPFEFDQGQPAESSTRSQETINQVKQANTLTPGNSIFDFRDDVTVQLAGVSYVAFIQVVSVPVTSTARSASATSAGGSIISIESPRQRVLVCGLIAKERLRREAIQLSPQTLILVGALVAFGIFAIPFLKLRFIGERERMRQRDVWLLAASILSTTALMVLVIQDVHAIIKLHRRFDSGLMQFTVAVAAHLKDEGDAILAEVKTSVPALLVDQEVTETAYPSTLKCNLPTSIPQAPPIGSILARRDLRSYPDIEALIVTDLCGYQMRKWMARTLPTPNISVADESYFATALALPTSLSESHTDFAFGATLAPTSGLLLGVYAMPVDGRTREYGAHVEMRNRTGIVALATQLQSVTSPIVARPFQFVLVDRNGAVTFQTLQGSFRGEHFFESINGADSLQRAARAPARDLHPKTYQYRGKVYRMTALYLPALQSTLVASYELSVVGELAARIFSTAALEALGIVGAILLGAALSAAVSRKTSFDWAWPSTSRIRWYAVGIVICALAMLLLLLVRSVMSSPWLRWSIIAAPAVVIVLLETVCVPKMMRHALLMVIARVTPFRRPASPSAVPQSLLRMSLLHTSFGVMGLLAFIGVPTAVAFNDAFNLHCVAFSTEVSEVWQAAYAQWNDAISASLVNVGDPRSQFDCLSSADLHCSLPERIYVSKDNYKKLRDERAALALYTNCADLTSSKGLCSSDHEPPVPFSFTASMAGWLAEFGRDREAHIRTMFNIDHAQAGSVRTPLLAGFEWSNWAAAGVLALLVALWLLVSSIAKHVLGIRVTAGNLLDERNAIEQNDGTLWLLLRPSHQALEALRRPLESLDLRNAELSSLDRRPLSGRTLIIEHLEARSADKEWRQAVLQLLDGKTEGCVILTSELDPLYGLTQALHHRIGYLRSLRSEDKEKRAEIDATCHELRRELAEWANALRGVRKIREASPGFPAFQVGSPYAVLHAKLAEECGPAEELVEIGSRFLKRPDLDSYRWNDIVGFVLDAAEPYYRSIWELCSRDERLVLIQLAQTGFVNPKREAIAHRLGRRGLVILEPRYRLMNRSFQSFVCAAETQERVTDWEQTGATFSWARLGTPLYALAAMVIAVLLYAEQGLFTNLLAVATGGVATLGSLRSIYASMKKVTPAEGKPA